MEPLYNFTALIQLISAVNFANILFGYHKKVFRVLFNMKQIVDEKVKEIKKTMMIDLGSLRNMKPIKSIDGQSNEESINTLKADYENFDSEFQEAIESLYKECRAASDSNWIKTFFLFISLYCVLDLLLIALVYTFNTTFTHCILHIINFATVIFIVKYVVNIFKQASDPSYKVAIRDCAIIIISSIILSGINSLFIHWGYNFPIPDWVEISSLVLSILIPFLPCVLCFLYVSRIVKELRNKVEKNIDGLSKRSNKLHDRMTELNTVEKLFKKDKTITFG